VRLVLEHEVEHPSRWQAIVSIAAKIGCSAHSLNEWVKKAEVDAGKRAGVSTDMAARLKALERENRELRQANEILRKASAYFTLALSANARIRLSGERSSTAGRRHDRVHRRSSRRVWGRADLQAAADRPIDLPCSCRPAA
jgi:transposase-like protein